MLLLFSPSVPLFTMDCSTPSLPVPHDLPKFAQFPVHQTDDAIELSNPLLSPSPLALRLSQHQGFLPMSWLFTLCWICSFSISPSNEYSGLISFRIY